jgi:hypothetical protein
VQKIILFYFIKQCEILFTDESARKAEFVWSKYNPHTFDEEGMVLLEKSAKELFEPKKVIALIKHVQTVSRYHQCFSFSDL